MKKTNFSEIFKNELLSAKAWIAAFLSWFLIESIFKIGEGIIVMLNYFFSGKDINNLIIIAWLAILLLLYFFWRKIFKNSS